MQGYFEKKEWQKKEEKRLHLNTDRGMNLHRFSELKYKNGALHLSKHSVQKYTSDQDENKNKISENSKKIKKNKKLSYQEILKERETNSEFATGKKYKRAKGAAKKFMKKKK